MFSMSDIEDTVEFHRPVLDLGATIQAIESVLPPPDRARSPVNAAIAGKSKQAQEAIALSFARVAKVEPVYKTNERKPHQP